MTQLPGRSTLHHAGDGCTGQRRNLDFGEGGEIRAASTPLLNAICADQLDVAVNTGASIGLHYGPEGEWLLASVLAELISRHAPRDPGGSPLLFSTVLISDPQAHELTAVLALRHGKPIPPEASRNALKTAQAWTQEFVNGIHTGDHHAARNLWNRIHAVRGPAHPDPWPTALAFGALLLLWAARTKPIPAGRPYPAPVR